MSHESPGTSDPEQTAPPPAPSPPATPSGDPPYGVLPTPPSAYPPPAAYGQYGPPVYAPPSPPTNGLAIASLVLGIVSWIPFLWVGFVPGLVLGFVAKGQIDRSGGAQQGRGLAIAGIVLGLVGTGIMAAFFLLFLAAGLAGAAGA